MTRIGVSAALLTMLLGLAATRCDDPCTELSDQVAACCPQITDPDPVKQKNAIATCQEYAKEIIGYDPDACSLEVNNYQCSMVM